MAADNSEKRYSAMNLFSPWRGVNVIPNIGSLQNERQAAIFAYSGVLFRNKRTKSPVFIFLPDQP